MNRSAPQVRPPAGFPIQTSSAVRNAPGPAPGNMVSRLGSSKQIGPANWGGFSPQQTQPSQQQPTSAIGAFGQGLSNISQPATPFDISEFPVLGAGSASHNPTAGWGRISTQSPGAGQGRPLQDEIYQNHINSLEEYALQRSVGGPGQVGQGRNPRLGNSEEFPALPSSTSLVGDGLSERKSAFLMGSSAFQNGSHLDILSSHQQQQHDQQRQAFLGGIGSSTLQQSSARQQGSGGSGRSSVLNIQNAGPTSRLSPLDPSIHQQLSSESERKSNIPNSIAPPGTMPHGMSSRQALGSLSQRQQVQRPSSIAALQSQPDQPSDQPPRYSSTPPDTELSESSGPSDIDRFGLNGLLPLIRNEDLDMALLALGTDLTQLGLELNQPEQPLSATFGSPWTDQQVRAAEPDFKLPACYSVLNTQPLQSKVRNFSDETLFYIFYTMPRDVMQEIVAQELTQRNWRYHKELQVWLTKVQGNEPSQIVSGRFEKGVYAFFEPTVWERQEKDFVLEYAALDQSRMALS